MKKEQIIIAIEKIASEAEMTTIKVFLNVILGILKMDIRRIEGYITLISGFSEIPLHKRSSSNLGIHKRKNRKKVNS